MEFSVLNKQTIQCIMTEEEIAGYGMDKKAIFKNDARVQDFFRRVMQQAQEETGFVKERGNVMVHAVFLPDELLKITFSVDGTDQAGTAAEPKGDLAADDGAVFTTAVFKERKLKNLVRFCRQMPKVPKTCMYKYRNYYFLLSEIHALSMRQTASLFLLADEYVEDNGCEPGIAAYLKEHGTCMIAENAVEVLREL